MRSSLGVVIPAYNAEKFVTEAIESARECGATQVIVVDDGSSDRTVQVAEESGALVVVQENSGAAIARTNGAGHLTTDFVVFLDADDLLVPSGVTRSVEVLEADDSLSVAAGVVVGFSRNSSRETRFPIRYTPVNTSSLLTIGYGPWPPCNAVVRVTSLRASEALAVETIYPRFADDFELLIRLSMVGGVEVGDYPACRYCMDGGKSVHSANKALESKENLRRYYAEANGIEVTLMSQKEIKQAAQARLARAQFSSGNVLGGIASSIRWVAFGPDKILGAARKRLGSPTRRTHS